MTHLCAVGRHVKDGEHDGTPADTGLLCGTCLRRLEQTIAELPATCGWLAANTARSSFPGDYTGDQVDGSSDTPVPVNLTILALLGFAHDCAADGCHTPLCEPVCPGHHDRYGTDPTPSIPWVLFSWQRLILDKQPALAGPRETTVNALAAWLIARLRPWVAAQDWVVEMIRELDHVRAVAHAAAPWRLEPLEARRRPVPCKRCELLTLVWIPGGDANEVKYPFECVEKLGGCGRLYTADEYEQWARMLGAYHHAREAVA